MRIQFVVPRGHAAKLLEAAEEPLDGLALGIAGGVEGARVPPLAPGWNYRLCTAVGQGRHQRVGIVATVGDEVGWG